ncbi:hypothetical protein FOL47_010105 [Perkinsus chesapeaki]|uniref:Uncharacterized protein n=1 Tax=Perkinsus chesapeaki TaxID=330153 RepID=A0A7J6L4S0_PERCH|nr:hypothetical protein FOL47_010105 [Perkinsus chesapeaki]
MKSKSHKKIEWPLADPLYKSALAEYERTGTWPKLRRSGKLPAEVVKAKNDIEEKMKKMNTARLSQFFKKKDDTSSSTEPTSKAATSAHGGVTEEPVSSPDDQDATKSE